MTIYWIISIAACWWLVGTLIAIRRYPPGGWKMFGWRAYVACAIWGSSGPLVVFIVAKRRQK